MPSVEPIGDGSYMKWTRCAVTSRVRTWEEIYTWEKDGWNYEGLSEIEDKSLVVIAFAIIVPKGKTPLSPHENKEKKETSRCALM